MPFCNMTRAVRKFHKYMEKEEHLLSNSRRKVQINTMDGREEF